MMLGFLALALASVGQSYVRRHTGLPEDVADFTIGLLQGIAIATMLLGIWIRGRSR
jgi:hypothetical protein